MIVLEISLLSCTWSEGLLSQIHDILTPWHADFLTFRHLLQYFTFCDFWTRRQAGQGSPRRDDSLLVLCSACLTCMFCWDFTRAKFVHRYPHRWLWSMSQRNRCVVLFRFSVVLVTNWCKSLSYLLSIFPLYYLTQFRKVVRIARQIMHPAASISHMLDTATYYKAISIIAMPLALTVLPTTTVTPVSLMTVAAGVSLSLPLAKEPASPQTWEI